jgi:hypothetical protein
MSTLHQDSIIIDGLNISKFERPVFEDMRRGGITAANCTVSVWENFTKTVDNIGVMKQKIRENGELLTLVRTTDDIFRAKKEGKTGIILGFQNAHAFEDNLGWGVSIDGNVNVSGDRYHCPTEELSFLLNAHKGLEWVCPEIGQNRCVRVC